MSSFIPGPEVLVSVPSSQTQSRPFTAAEEAVWLSDRPGDPRVIALVCRLDAPANVARLSAALANLVRTEPLLQVRPAPGNSFARQRLWEPAADLVAAPLVIAQGNVQALTSVVERLRLAVQKQPPGLAAGLVQDPRGDTVVLAVHHALTDGIGVLELLRRLLTIDGVAADARRLSPVRQSSPTDASRTVSACPRRRRRRRRPIMPPTRLAQQASGEDRYGFGFRVGAVLLDQPPAPATTNDVLVAATILAVERWNTLHRRRSGRITVHLPMNARPLPQRYAGIGNATGRATVSSARGPRDPRRLLDEVAAATIAAKLSGPTPWTPAERAVTALRWLPAGLRSVMLRGLGRRLARWIMPTITVSNLGPVDSRLGCGEGRAPAVRSLHFLTTAGMPQGITVTAAKLDGVLNVGVNYARALLDDDAADAFLAMTIEGARALSGRADAAL